MSQFVFSLFPTTQILLSFEAVPISNTGIGTIYQPSWNSDIVTFWYKDMSQEIKKCFPGA